jgi:hypothetical protein
VGATGEALRLAVAVNRLIESQAEVLRSIALSRGDLQEPGVAAELARLAVQGAALAPGCT